MLFTLKKPDLVVKVEGMMCENCKKHVTSAIKNVENVENVNVNLKTKEAKIYGKNIDLEKVKQAVEEAGYHLA